MLELLVILAMKNNVLYGRILQQFFADSYKKNVEISSRVRNSNFRRPVI